MLNDLTLQQIFNKYSLPERFLAYFASQCAKDILSRVKNPDPRSLAAMEMAEAYGNGEDFTEAHKREIIDDADAAAHSRGNAALSAPSAYSYSAAIRAANAYSAYAAAYITCVTATYGAAAYAHGAANAYSAYPAAIDYYKPLLLSLINTRLTELEKVLIFGTALT